MRAADAHLPAVHAKHPQPEVCRAGQFLGGEGPGTTLWTERSGQVLGEGSGLDVERGAGYVDRLLVGAWGLGRSPAGRRAVCSGVMGPAPRPRRRFRAEDQAGTESPCSQVCQAGSSRRT